ncbi:hypothetical protein HZA26_01205 [Candidatus Nomurabacteria bacterium]|nr:hypothetical protein [Candidatus Nomurabacteria bacterium]
MKMNLRKYALAIIAFIVVGFIVTFIWHLVLFGSVYQKLYLVTIPSPIFALGFLSFVIEGLAFVYVFEKFRRGKNPAREGLLFGILVYSLLMGSVAVIAHAAKHDVGNMALWFSLEGSYFIIVGAVLGTIVGLIYGKSPSQ